MVDFDILTPQKGGIRCIFFGGKQLLGPVLGANIFFFPRKTNSCLLAWLAFGEAFPEASMMQLADQFCRQSSSLQHESTC